MASKNNSGSNAAYDAFNSVDKVVSKPVLGSDGAASWQEFRNKNPIVRDGGSRAPKAPLKKSDKLGTGLQSWEEERVRENKSRLESGASRLEEAGYTHFTEKNNQEEAQQRKEIQRIKSRVRPEDKEYYIPSKTFKGYKFDYVFTTRDWGTGYYWDGMDSVNKLNNKDKHDNETSQPQPQKRKQQPSNYDSIDESAPGAIKKKKRSKKANGPVIRDDPNNPMEQVAAALRRRQLQQQHQLEQNHQHYLQKQQLQQQQISNNNTDILPEGWESAKDPSSGKTYYFCRTTGTRQWTKPNDNKNTPTDVAKKDDIYHNVTVDNEKEKGVQKTTLQQQPVEALPEGWYAAKDSTTGKVYYYNRNGETKWERPS